MGGCLLACLIIAPQRGYDEHRTRTVDYAVVLSGEIDMMLDDSVVHVRAVGGVARGRGGTMRTIPLPVVERRSRDPEVKDVSG